MFCLITDLHDHAAYPAGQLAAACAWPASALAPPPRACPPRWPRPPAAIPCAPSADAGSSSTAAGTATAKPKPARPSPAPDATSPRVPRSPRSTSAARQRPDRHRAVTGSDPCPKRRTWNRPPARSDSRVAPMPVTLRNRNRRRSASTRTPSRTLITLKYMALGSDRRHVPVSAGCGGERQPWRG